MRRSDLTAIGAVVLSCVGASAATLPAPAGTNALLADLRRHMQRLLTCAVHTAREMAERPV